MDTACSSVPLVRFIAQVGRENGHAAPTTATTTTTTKGPSPMSGESRPDALKRFRKLTSELHTARCRQDYLRARELAEERDATKCAIISWRRFADCRPQRAQGRLMARTLTPTEWANLSLAERENRQRHAAQRARKSRAFTTCRWRTSPSTRTAASACVVAVLLRRMEVESALNRRRSCTAFWTQSHQHGGRTMKNPDAYFIDEPDRIALLETPSADPEYLRTAGQINGRTPGPIWNATPSGLLEMFRPDIWRRCVDRGVRRGSFVELRLGPPEELKTRRICIVSISSHTRKVTLSDREQPRRFQDREPRRVGEIKAAA